MGLRYGICYFGVLALMKIYTPGDCIHCAAWTGKRRVWEL